MCICLSENRVTRWAVCTYSTSRIRVCTYACMFTGIILYLVNHPPSLVTGSWVPTGVQLSLPNSYSSGTSSGAILVVLVLESTSTARAVPWAQLFFPRDLSPNHFLPSKNFPKKELNSETHVGNPSIRSACYHPRRRSEALEREERRQFTGPLEPRSTSAWLAWVGLVVVVGNDQLNMNLSSEGVAVTGGFSWTSRITRMEILRLVVFLLPLQKNEKRKGIKTKTKGKNNSPFSRSISWN